MSIKDNLLTIFADLIKNERIQLKTLEIISSDFDKMPIVLEMKSINNKVKALKFISDDSLKLSIIKTIKDDSIKMQLIKDIKEEELKVEIIKTIEDDSIKIQLIKDINEEQFKADIITLIEDDETKIKLLKEIHNDELKKYIIKTIKNPEKKSKLLNMFIVKEETRKKIENLGPYNYRNKVKILQSVHYDNIKIELLNEIKEENSKAEVIKTIENDNQKIEALKKLYTDKYKTEIIKIIKSDTQKFKLLDQIASEQYKIKIIESFENDKMKLEALSKMQTDVGKIQIIKTIEDIDIYIDSIKKVNKSNNTDYKRLKYNLKEMKKSNEYVQRNIDTRLLTDNRYIDTLGIEKVNLISCYPSIQSKLLEINDAELRILFKCIESFEKKQDNFEWTKMASVIINNISKYDKLIENIGNLDNIDIDKVSKIMQRDNLFEIKTKEDINNFDKIKQEKCNELIKSSTIEEKKLAILQKLFGQDFEYTNSIINKYGEDINEIENQELRDYVTALKKIMETSNEKVLEKIFYECEECPMINLCSMEGDLKKEYLKLYTKDLFKVEDATKIEDGIYEANPQGFKMIMTALQPFASRNRIENYKNDWNRPSLATQHFCASYIRNDMIGTAPVYDICYRIFRSSSKFIMPFWKN